MNLSKRSKTTYSGAATAFIRDEELVLAAKAEDKEAFTELWKRHSTVVYRSIYRILKNHEDAEDALQESFFKAFICISGFKGDAKFSTWMTRIAINTALAELRKRRSRPSSPLEEMSDDETRRYLDIPDKSIDIEQAYERLEAFGHIRIAIEHLTPGLQKLVKMKHLHDCTDKELAALTDTSLSTVKSGLCRARRALRSFCCYGLP